MNTEAINTLKQIREVINELQVLHNDESLKNSDRNLVEQVLSKLCEMEDTIITETLQAMVDKLNAANEDLLTLIAEMEEASDKIASFSSIIQKISNVVGVLAEITVKAISAGIVS